MYTKNGLENTILKNYLFLRAADDIEDWDSLTHITLISAIEEEFGMKFSMKEVVGMNNVGELAEIVAARRKR